MTSGLPGLFQNIAQAMSFFRVNFSAWKYLHISVFCTLSSLVHCLLPSFLHVGDRHTLCLVTMRFQGVNCNEEDMTSVSTSI